MIRFKRETVRTTKSGGRRHRSGMILAIVLAALLVVMLLGAALTNAFLAHRQFLRHSEQRQQAFWIAESAMQRAAYRFSKELGYEGETWEVSADDLGGACSAVAVVRIETVADGETGHRIIVDATYPSNTLKKIVQHRELFIIESNEVPR